MFFDPRIIYALFWLGMVILLSYVIGFSQSHNFDNPHQGLWRIGVGGTLLVLVFAGCSLVVGVIRFVRDTLDERAEALGLTGSDEEASIDTPTYGGRARRRGARTGSAGLFEYLRKLGKRRQASDIVSSINSLYWQIGITNPSTARYNTLVRSRQHNDEQLLRDLASYELEMKKLVDVFSSVSKELGDMIDSARDKGKSKICAEIMDVFQELRSNNIKQKALDGHWQQYADLVLGKLGTATSIVSGGRKKSGAAYTDNQFHPNHDSGASAKKDPDTRVVQADREALARSYLTLGVSPSESYSAIRGRYLELIRQCHPDAHSGDSADDANEATERAKRINLAWQNIEKSRARSKP